MLCQKAVRQEEDRHGPHETKRQSLPGKAHGEGEEQDAHVHQPEAQGGEEHHQQDPSPDQVVMTRQFEVTVRQVDMQSQGSDGHEETRVGGQHAIDTIVEGGEEGGCQREHHNAQEHRQLRYHPIVERVRDYLPRRHQLFGC